MTTVDWGGATDVGRVRAENEDAVLADGSVFVVADGMGGAAAGGTASRLAVSEFAAPLSTADDVRKAVARANDAILESAQSQSERAGMGTTLVGLTMISDRGESYWLLFSIGDSRAYRISGGELEQLTVDHAVGTALTRVLGAGPDPQVDYWLLAPTPGERFLLCSDGLTRELDDERLRTALAGTGSPDSVARELVDAAVAAGGRDNVSAVVVDVRP